MHQSSNTTYFAFFELRFTTKIQYTQKEPKKSTKKCLQEIGQKFLNSVCQKKSKQILNLITEKMLIK